MIRRSAASSTDAFPAGFRPSRTTRHTALCAQKHMICALRPQSRRSSQPLRVGDLALFVCTKGMRSNCCRDVSAPTEHGRFCTPVHKRVHRQRPHFGNAGRLLGAGPRETQVQFRSGAGGHIGGEDVVRVAVQVLAGPVIPHHGARGMRKSACLVRLTVSRARE